MTADIQVEKASSQSLTPNELGLFPRVVVPSQSRIQISANYPSIQEGEVILVSAEDGGMLDNHKPVMPVMVGPGGQVQFGFTTSADEGIFRVTLRKGADEKQFDFWVGPEPILQQ